MAVEVHLLDPINGATGVAITTNFKMNISSGSIQKVQLWLNGELEQENEVINWSGIKYFNPTDDLAVNTEYSWYLKVQDWSAPFDWYQSVETWSFDTNILPGKPTNPSPADDATDITLDETSLSWDASDPAADTYEIYFRIQGDDWGLVGEAQAGVEWAISFGTLNYGTTYEWRVDATNAYGTTTGDTWTFGSIVFDPPLPTGITLDAEGEPAGTPTGENNMYTIKRLIIAANNKIFYEDV
jgi:hypothetical protein